MGILNITPDSFYDGNKNFTSNAINQSLKKLLKCDIIDVGAESSRPGSKRITNTEELDRLELLFDLKIDFTKYIFSIDTYRPTTAYHCLNKGFKIVNDITGGSEEMFKLCKDFGAKIIIMHMNGTPETMQRQIDSGNILEKIDRFFKKQISKARECGLKDSQIIIDPGLGFGKRLEDNYTILKNLNSYKKFNLPIMVGLSRKSFLSNLQPKDKLINTIISNTYACLNGVNIIRVHDVEEHLLLKNMLANF